MADPLTPSWWLDRLYKRLLDRRPLLESAEAWYCGPQPTPRGYEKAREILRRLQDMADANFCALVTDAAVERMHIEGFKVGGQIADRPWEIWQSNGFDLGSEMVFSDAMSQGESYVLVDPNSNADGLPTLTPEHASQAIVAYLPGRMNQRAAGLKVWVDDLLDPPLLMAAVYLAQDVSVYAAAMSNGKVPDKPVWELQESLSGRHGLGEVPLVAFPNRPRMMRDGITEFDRILPIQRRVNKTLLDRLVMQEFGAFKQKWATGMEIPVDEAGAAIEPVNVAITRLLASPSGDVTFGQFEADDVRPLLEAISSDVKQIAAIVPTPPHYLLGDMVNLSAEALKAAEAALVSRVRAHMRHREEPLEAVVRLAMRAAGQDVPSLASTQCVWRNPEFRTEGELVDALVKMRTLGVPYKALWERWGATPQEIEAWPGMLLQEQATAGLANFLSQPQPSQQPLMPTPQS